MQHLNLYYIATYVVCLVFSSDNFRQMQQLVKIGVINYVQKISYSIYVNNLYRDNMVTYVDTSRGKLHEGKIIFYSNLFT